MKNRPEPRGSYLDGLDRIDAAVTTWIVPGASVFTEDPRRRRVPVSGTVGDGSASVVSVTVDGGLSYDPDFPADAQPSQLNYDWVVRLNNSTVETASGETPSLELEPGVYEVQLIVSDATRDSEPTKVILTVVSANVPEVSLVCDQAVSSEPFVCEGRVTGADGKRYDFDITEGELAGGATLEDRAMTAVGGTIAATPMYLKLLTFSLTPGADYAFALTAEGGGRAEVFVTANVAPTGGVVTADPPSGEGWRQKFALSQEFWVSSHLPLNFGFSKAAGRGAIPLLGFAPSPNANDVIDRAWKSS